jgi:hypothetical protein
VYEALFADDCILTCIVVEAKVPLADTTSGVVIFPTLEAKVDDVETSKPLGGVMVTPELIDVPDTEKD